MPRKFKSTASFLKPDPRYNNATLSKFINFVMLDGKKSTAQRMVYEALDTLKERFPEQDAIDTFLTAIDNVKPSVEVKSKRIGGANYQVPIKVERNRQQYLAFTWVVIAVRAKKGKPFAVCLADELSDAYKREGVAIKKREDMHRMADANRAFAQFAW